MKKTLLAVISVLFLSSLACSITLPVNRVQVGEKQTFNVSQPAPGDQAEMHATINMGAGTLKLAGGSNQLIEGQIVYNVASMDPSINTGDHSVSISQSNELHDIPSGDIVNDWNLKLGKTPIDLSINAGAYQGTMDFGGVPLTQLFIRDGASQVKVNFSEPNPQKMSRLEYDTGASNVEMDGLANANFDEMRFEGGAGSFKLDFSGKLQRDGHVQIVGGVNDIEITIPKGMPVTINLSGALSNVNTDGTWTIHGKTYEATGSGPHLTIDVENGVGNLNLMQK
jgi:hypothetical protein